MDPHGHIHQPLSGDEQPAVDDAVKVDRQVKDGNVDDVLFHESLSNRCYGNSGNEVFRIGSQTFWFF